MAESRKSEERQINESLTMEESETYSWWSGHKQRGHCQENHNNPQKKNWHLRACSRGEKVTSNGSQELGAGTLLNQLFPCRKLQDEVIEHGLTILADLGLPPFEETSMCHENLWCFNWVSSYPRGQIRPPKRWAWSHTHLWSPCFPCASGKRWSQPSWWKRVQHPRFLGPSSKIQPRTPDDFVYLLQDVARTHQSWVLRKFESKGYA